MWNWWRGSSANADRSIPVIESDVENADAVGQPADRDQIDAAGGDRWRGRRCDAAGGFRYRPARHHSDRRRQGFRIHVVEQHGVDAVIERLAELIERIDLEFDLDEMTDPRLRALQGFGDAAGDGDMVVLDQHGIVETEAVIAAAADADRVFFDGPQSRRGLA